MFALEYHDTTKHHFNRFARSLGYLDWAAQPDPFRRYAGAPVLELPRAARRDNVSYHALYGGAVPAAPLETGTVGEFLRCAMGLSAWKAYRGTRWALRVNPSSGNLHPTETYVIADGRVCHYLPREHALEARCTIDPAAWRAFSGGADGFLVALTSIHWREAWKYGERAFRYCQHDVGHALGALRMAAALLGWRLSLLPRWSDTAIETLLGVNREAGDAEHEEADCLAVVTPGAVQAWREADPEPLALAAAGGAWHGTPNRLSAQRVGWPIIDRVAGVTRYPGAPPPLPHHTEVPPAPAPAAAAGGGPPARTIILQRRSAVAFDARTSMSRETLVAMLRRLLPGAPPWDAVDWPPHVHLVLFVHRVEGLVPGVYVFLRDAGTLEEWRTALRSECLWEQASSDPADAASRLFLLIPADVRWAANRLSCDQEIASDGFLSLGMVARFEAPLRERGEWFYRRLFWECGLIGQILYLEAEAAGARSTGIGCFYDDAVHETLGFTGHAWQSLYHFSMGMPVEDTRLTSEPGYEWEGRAHLL